MSHLSHTTTNQSRPLLQSSAQLFIHNAIFFIDTLNNAWYNQVHWLIGTPYLSIITSNAYAFFFTIFAIYERQMVKCVIIVLSGEVSIIYQRETLSVLWEPSNYRTGHIQIKVVPGCHHFYLNTTRAPGWEFVQYWIQIVISRWHSPLQSWSKMVLWC